MTLANKPVWFRIAIIPILMLVCLIVGVAFVAFALFGVIITPYMCICRPHKVNWNHNEPSVAKNFVDSFADSFNRTTH